MQVFINLIQYTQDHAQAILALLGGGAGLSVILEYVLNKSHIDSKKLAYTLIHVLSIVSALALWYLDNKGILPAYAGLVIAAQTIHRFAISPVYNNQILPYLEYKATKKVVPAPLPVTPQVGNASQSVVPDFSE